MLVAMAMTAGAFQRRRHLVEADRAVAILVELAEHVVGLREVGAAGAQRIFEFRLADLAITIGVELRKQVLQRIGPAGWGRGTRRLTLRGEQRGHGRRRYAAARRTSGRTRGWACSG